MKLKYLLLFWAFLLVSVAVAHAEIDQESRRIAIETIILEAQGESLSGQVAVGEVLRNRAFKARSTIKEVALKPYQFSCWNDRHEAKRRLNRVSGEVYQRASRAWELSEHSSLTDGARHYHALSVRPSWAKSGTVTARIGQHVFYKGVK